jgi:hypothetical protein
MGLGWRGTSTACLRVATDMRQKRSTPRPRVDEGLSRRYCPIRAAVPAHVYVLAGLMLFLGVSAILVTPTMGSKRG